MKKYFYILLGMFLMVGGTAFAVTTFNVQQGGTGATSFTSSRLLYGAGTNAVQTVATTSASCSGNASCTAFTVIGSSPITITATGGSGSGNVATSTNEVSGQVATFSSNSATPATIAGNTNFTFVSPLLTVKQASTTLFSVFNTAYFGATATSTFNSVGDLFVVGSTTLQNFTARNATTSSATTTSLAITGGAANCNGTSALTTSSTGNVTCTAQPQGTVTAVSIATANGFSGSSTGGATPALTIIASGCNGVCKSNATTLSTATAGVDYLASYDPFNHSTVNGATASGTTTPMAFFNASYFGATGTTTITSAGLVGVGTTSPFANLSIHQFANAGTVNNTLFAIASSTASATTTLLSTTSGGQTASCEDVYGKTANGARFASSTAMRIDFQQTCNQVLLQVGSASFTVTAVNAKVGDTKRINIVNPSGSTAGAITWSGVVWLTGTTPTQTQTANGGDIYSCMATQATSTSSGTVKIECNQGAGLQ